MHTAHITLDGDEHAPRRARAALRRVFRERQALRSSAHEVLADAELLVSELVTNAVLHARSACTVVDVAVGPDVVVIGVTDPDPRLGLVTPTAQDPGEAGGFGLRIVEQLASRWGIEPHAEGKRVWFALPLSQHEAGGDQQRADLAS